MLWKYETYFLDRGGFGPGLVHWSEECGASNKPPQPPMGSRGIGVRGCKPVLEAFQ